MHAGGEKPCVYPRPRPRAGLREAHVDADGQRRDDSDDDRGGGDQDGQVRADGTGGQEFAGGLDEVGDEVDVDKDLRPAWQRFDGDEGVGERGEGSRMKIATPWRDSGVRGR